jgi:putative ABC transport system permease protein
VVINESLAKRFFQGEDALGKKITFDNPADSQAHWANIVGIVGDTRRGGVTHAPWAEVYYPLAQVPDPRMYALIRTPGDPLAMVRPAQAEVWAVDRNQPIQSIRTVEGLLARSQANRRFTTVLLGLFSIIALALAVIGIYGVVAYSTAQRTHEIGIRMALGARRNDILTMVLKEGGMIGAVGISVGIATALALTHFMSGLLFGIGARDPITFIALPAGLLLVIAAATLVPAARALRINPIAALRGE